MTICAAAPRLRPSTRRTGLRVRVPAKSAPTAASCRICCSVRAGHRADHARSRCRGPAHLGGGRTGARAARAAGPARADSPAGRYLHRRAGSRVGGVARERGAAGRRRGRGCFGTPGRRQRRHSPGRSLPSSRPSAPPLPRSASCARKRTRCTCGRMASTSAPTVPYWRCRCRSRSRCCRRCAIAQATRGCRSGSRANCTSRFRSPSIRGAVRGSETAFWCWTRAVRQAGLRRSPRRSRAARAQMPSSSSRTAAIAGSRLCRCPTELRPRARRGSHALGGRAVQRRLVPPPPSRLVAAGRRGRRGPAWPCASRGRAHRGRVCGTFEGALAAATAPPPRCSRSATARQMY